MMSGIFHGWRFKVPADPKEAPFLWMGSLQNVWLEFPAATTHSDLVSLAERLCREFGGIVIERYPEQWIEDGKEYWTIEVAGQSLLIMRKGSIGIGAGSGMNTNVEASIELLIQIAKGMGVERFVGWRWILWRIRRLSLNSSRSS